jgi:type VI secretion system protein ImpK
MPGLPAGAAAPMLGEAESLPKVGMSQLASCASPLFDLLSRLSANVNVAAPDELRERAIRAIRTFETEAREAGISPDQLRAAHYALCAALDDVALATPWGRGSTWGARSLASTFHQDVKAGERVFDLLAGMMKDPGRYKEALEVTYMCLALGLQGKYRLSQRGAAELDRVREGLYQLLVQLRGGWERELSPHWKGVDAPHRRSGRNIPAWLAIPICLALLGGGYYVLSQELDRIGNDLFARLAALPPGAVPDIQRLAPVVPPAPPPPPPPNAPPSLAVRLRGFLEPEIAARLVTVEEDANRTLVRIAGSGMFAVGSPDVEPRFVGLLQRIGQALREEPGAVRTVGHSDNQRISTPRFRNNVALSLARAQAAQEIMVAAFGGNPARFTAEGRGEAEPLVPNTTPQGQAQNRRIDVAVLKEGSR